MSAIFIILKKTSWYTIFYSLIFVLPSSILKLYSSYWDSGSTISVYLNFGSEKKINIKQILTEFKYILPHTHFFFEFFVRNSFMPGPKNPQNCEKGKKMHGGNGWSYIALHLCSSSRRRTRTCRNSATGTMAATCRTPSTSRTRARARSPPPARCSTPTTPSTTRRPSPPPSPRHRRAEPLLLRRPTTSAPRATRRRRRRQPLRRRLAVPPPRRWWWRDAAGKKRRRADKRRRRSSYSVEHSPSPSPLHPYSDSGSGSYGGGLVANSRAKGGGGGAPRGNETVS